MQLPEILKDKLIRLPFVGRTIKNLEAQGHTGEEAETGGLLVALLDIFVGILLINLILAGNKYAQWRNKEMVVNEGIAAPPYMKCPCPAS